MMFQKSPLDFVYQKEYYLNSIIKWQHAIPKVGSDGQTHHAKPKAGSGGQTQYTGVFRKQGGNDE